MPEKSTQRINEDSWSAHLATKKGASKETDGIGLGIAKLIGPGKRILDIGCGSGKTLFALRAAGSDVVGTDVSESALSACRARGFNVFQFDIENDPIDTLRSQGLFDVVVFADVLEHLMDPLVILRDKILPILKPGGRVIATIPNFVFLHYRLEILSGKISHFNNDDTTGYDPPRPYNLGHKTMFSRKNCYETFELAGFNDVDVQVELFSESLGGFWRIPLLRELRNGLKRLWPTLLGARFLVVAKKA